MNLVQGRRESITQDSESRTSNALSSGHASQSRRVSRSESFRPIGYVGLDTTGPIGSKAALERESTPTAAIPISEH